MQSQRKRRPSITIDTDDLDGQAYAATRSPRPSQPPPSGGRTRADSAVLGRAERGSFGAKGKSGIMSGWLKGGTETLANGHAFEDDHRRRAGGKVTGALPPVVLDVIATVAQWIRDTLADVRTIASDGRASLRRGRDRSPSRKIRLRGSRPLSIRRLVLIAGTVILVLFVILRRSIASWGAMLTFLRVRDPIVSLDLSPALVRRIWAYEVAAGHFPSRRMPSSIALGPRDMGELTNTGLPPGDAALQSLYLIPATGPRRTYLDFPAPFSHTRPRSYPPRPTPHSAIDMDVVMRYCDFSADKYVRDCLEMLSTASALDLGKSVRLRKPQGWRHLYVEDRSNWHGRPGGRAAEPFDILHALGWRPGHKHEEIEAPVPTPPIYHELHPTADPACDPEAPRIFHMLWAGPFTDKPYATALGFLFSQNVGLHLPLADEPDPEGAREAFLRTTCRPQLWIHINPGPAAAAPDPRRRERMYEELRSNPWALPLLHPRFSEVLSFHFYNTTAHLDSIPELRDEWRHMPLFKSGQVVFNQPRKAEAAPAVVLHGDAAAQARTEEGAQEHGARRRKAAQAGDEADDEDDAPAEAVDNALLGQRKTGVESDDELALAEGQQRDGIDLDSGSGRGPAPVPVVTPSKAASSGGGEASMYERVGSASYAEYDRLSTTLSDMARFILTHRFGGVYIDADTLLLRDWEELWGWRGAFAYRWSRLPEYNTALLRMHRGSALGSFIFKIALANGLDFHPMSVWQYLSRAKLDGLLLRAPDALFDSAWLNTEYYQRDRPPFPYFTRFEDFFQPSNETAISPLVTGVEHFFRGAFAYHWHNQWWVPFDPTQNWPALGPRFARAEALQKGALAAEAARLAATRSAPPASATTAMAATASASARPRKSPPEPDTEGDLSWATVLKRTYEAYLRGERPNLYGEWIAWNDVEEGGDGYSP